MRTLKPQTLKASYWTRIERQLSWIFYEVLFQPIYSLIIDTNSQIARPLAYKDMVANASEGSPLRDALRSGRVQYAQGVFSGVFSAAISRGLRSLGAAFSPREKTYRLDPAAVPAWVQVEAVAYQSRAKAAHQSIVRSLNDLQVNLKDALRGKSVDAGDALKPIERDFRQTAQAIGVMPELSEHAKQELNADYTVNMDIWIKKWIEEQIIDLRERVEENSLAGARFDRLIDTVKERYGVSRTKAVFLARQETSLFMSKYRRERFTEAGVRRYKWSTSHDERVRSSHKHLDGRIFAYADPPVTDLTTGAKNNPGEDFNCRCVDIPILDRVEVDA